MSAGLYRPSIEDRLSQTLRLRQVEDELATLDAIDEEYRRQERRRQLHEARRAETDTTPSRACPDISKQHQQWVNVFHNLGPHPDRDSDCSICQCELGANDEVLRHAGCDNCFHPECLLDWTDYLNADSKTPTCPMCRDEFINSGTAHTEIDIAVERSEHLTDVDIWGISGHVRDGFYDVALELAHERAIDISQYLRRYHVEDAVQIQDWIEIEYERLAVSFDFVVDYDYLRQRFDERERRYRRRHSRRLSVQLRREDAFYYDLDY